MLRDKRVVITRASSGIGLATAERFARGGARLALIARSAEGFAEAARRAREHGATVAETFVADVSEPGGRRARRGRCGGTLGGIDVFVPAAAGLAYGAFEEMPPEVFDRSFEVTFLDAISSVRAALPHLERTDGILIAVVSMASRVLVPLHSPYVAAKHALRGCLATLRVELRSRESGVRVCMVHPAFINTPFFENSTSVPRTVPRPLRPVYRPEVVAEAVLECARRPRPEVAVGGSAAALTGARHGGPSAPRPRPVDYGVRWQKTDLPASELGMLWAPSGRGQARPLGRTAKPVDGAPAPERTHREASVTISGETPLEERRVEVGGLRVASLEAGEGPPLVLLHGEGDSAASWRPVLPKLARSRRVYAPSLPGHGDSDKPRADYTPEFYGSFLADFLDAIGVDRATLVGHSLGGLVSMRFALAEPERVGALVLVDSSGLGRAVNPALSLLSLPGVRHVAGAWTRTHLGALQRPFVRSTLQFARPWRAPREWLADQRRLARTPGFLDAFLTTNRRLVGLRGQHDVVVGQLGALNMPTLVVWGARDAIVPVSHARAAVRRLPRGELVVIPDAGHAPHLERPRAFLAAVEPFLAQRAVGHPAK